MLGCLFPSRPRLVQSIHDAAQPGDVDLAVDVTRGAAKACHARARKIGPLRPLARLRIEEIDALRDSAVLVHAADRNQLAVPLADGQSTALERLLGQLLPAVVWIGEIVN